jgi:KaiC/GvpD/RAD55 family RecA-like ATPase
MARPRRLATRSHQPSAAPAFAKVAIVVHGAARGESGVFVTFEETEEDLLKNAASLGYDVPGLIERKRLALDPARLIDVIRELNQRPA